MFMLVATIEPEELDPGRGDLVTDEQPTEPVRTRKRRILRRVLAVVGVLVLIAAGGGAWALNRYVIDHVEIADVEAYEAEVLATASTAAPSTVPVEVPATGVSVVAADSTTATTSTTAAPDRKSVV